MKFFLIFFSVLVSQTCFAQLSKTTTLALNKTVHEMDATTETSIQIVRLSDGKVLFERDENKLRIPASVTKIVTAATILAKFDAPHQFSTDFYITGERKDGVVKGDLVIVGDGDPFIVSEQLWQLAADFKHMGIKSISGNLVIDNSLFAGTGRDASRKFGKQSSRNAYDAPVSAFGVNFNTFATAVFPNEDVGKPAFVNLDPYPIRGIEITNKVITKNKSTRLNIRVQRQSSSGNDRIVASGVIPINSLLYKKYRSVSDFVQASGETVRAFLLAQGILINGKVVEGGLPQNSKKIHTLYGYPIRKIVEGLNTFSNNYIADVMIKRLGAAYPLKGAANAAGQGTYENGLAVVSQFLKKEVGIKSEFEILNGSGLSTDNRLSAAQIVKLLKYMAKSMQMYPEFLGSLPASGWDGTMEKRMRDNAKKHGLVRAKTGTLTSPVSVAGLAGYTSHPKHGLIAFCILDNGMKSKKQPAISALRDRQDKLLIQLLKD